MQWEKTIPQQSLLYHDRRVIDYGRCIRLRLPSQSPPLDVLARRLPFLFPVWLQPVFRLISIHNLYRNGKEVILGSHLRSLEYRISFLNPDFCRHSLVITLIVTLNANPELFCLLPLNMLVFLVTPGMQKRLDRLCEKCTSDI
jgi:hypothetical protein